MLRIFGLGKQFFFFPFDFKSNVLIFRQKRFSIFSNFSANLCKCNQGNKFSHYDNRHHSGKDVDGDCHRRAAATATALFILPRALGSRKTF